MSEPTFLAKDAVTIQSMFNRIATNYDRLNRVLSLRQDVKWRQAVARFLPAQSKISLLDLATGTGDQILMLKSQLVGSRIYRAVGLDISEEMLKVGRQKVQALSLKDVELKSGDATAIPFEEGSFDAVTIAFGIRNIDRVEVALSDMYRVLKRHGRAVILEFSIPTHPWLKKGYLYYFRTWLPKIGARLSGDEDAYRYLNQSVESFFAPEVLIGKMREAGFQDVKAVPLTFGIATIYVGTKHV